MRPPHPPGTFRQRLFARFMAAADEQSHAMYASRKQRLFASLRGTVVEIGPGTGVNLRFFPPSIRWIGLEPNPAMHPLLRAEAKRLGREVEIIAGTLSNTGLSAGSVDAVVSTLVLCSVASMNRLLAEIRLVLRAGGVFVFIEHVADRRGSLRHALQRAAAYTPYRYFSDGCDPARDIAGAIGAAGFSDLVITRYMQPGAGVVMALNRPHICGVATK